MSGPLFKTSSGSTLTELKAARWGRRTRVHDQGRSTAHAVTEAESMPNDERVKLVQLLIRDDASVKARTIRTVRLPAVRAARDLQRSDAYVARSDDEGNCLGHVTRAW
jgi:hypothetical protein